MAAHYFYCYMHLTSLMLLLLHHTRVLIERREKCEFYCPGPPLARKIRAIPLRFGMNEPSEREREQRVT